MKINSENIDELMFQLLEGDIQGEERTHLLEAIAADKEYSALWQAWQQTVLNPNDELIVMPLAPLMKKRKVVLWSWKYGVAAMLCISIGASMLYFSSNQQGHLVESVSKPKNPKLEIIKVPTNEPVSNRLKEMDTVVTLKQKIETLAKHRQSPQFNPQRLPESPLPFSNFEPAFADKTPTKTMEQKPLIEHPIVPKIVVPKESQVIFASTENTGVSLSVYTETEVPKEKPFLGQKLQEKRNLLTRIFSAPKFQVVNDSSRFTNRKIILENKAYKIIAGF
jgi:hypothetical protein